MFRQAIEIFYSEEDEGYIAIVPELRGCTTFGNTQIEALKEVLDAWDPGSRMRGKMELISRNQQSIEYYLMRWSLSAKVKRPYPDYCLINNQASLLFLSLGYY